MTPAHSRTSSSVTYAPVGTRRADARATPGRSQGGNALGGWSLRLMLEPGDRLLLAEVYQEVGDTEGCDDAVYEVPEDCADWDALPEEEEEHEHGQKAKAARHDSQLDRKPGSDHAEAVEGRDRDQVEHDRSHLQEHQEGQRRPEMEVAGGRLTMEQNKRPADQHGEDQVADRSGC